MEIIEFLRQFRVGEYAVFDFAVSFLGIYLLAPLLSRIFRKLRLDIPRRSWLFWTLPIGIFFHLLVGEITPMTKNFIDTDGNIILKVFIIGLFVLGIKGIKINSRDSLVKKD